VTARFASQHAEALFVSTVTQAEMLIGAPLLPAGRRRAQLEQQLHAMLDEDFERRVLPFDGDAARIDAGVVSRRRQVGHPISQFDAQIAAIALARRASLVTRDVDNFEGRKRALVNPWTGPT
jgi:toxin FitB